jgi:PAS domain S-box-containing protein
VLTRFWHRRVCEAAFLVSVAVIALYLWTLLKISPDFSESFIVNLPAMVLASITALVSLVAYFWTPPKITYLFTLAIYLLLSATTAILVMSTGGAQSPFVTLWMLISIFAGIFGLWGTMPILVAICTFAAVSYIRGGFTIDTIVTIVISGLLPLIIGAIIWYKKSENDESNGDDRAYRNLANELTEVASKSEVVINAIGDGVMAIDNQGVIQLINPAAQRLIGWGKQDALTLNYKSVLQMVNEKNETLDVANDPIQQVLNTNQQIRTNNLSLITNSDKKIMISLVVSPVGEMGSGIIAVFHDITKEKAEEREQSEFISTASHEMRTPVASIEGYLGLAMNPQTAQIDSRARDFILKAHAAAEHLGHLFQDLLDVSKTDDGRISNNPKVVNIVTFVHDIVEGLEQKATEKGIRLIYRPMPDGMNERTIPPVFSVNLDNDHIREIVNNLVENAIKYTPKGEAMVDVTGDDEHVVISVKDSGIGIPAEDMTHLFQKFYRVDNKDTREIGGTGLGLYLSRRLAEIMGGRIWVESVYTRGSTFYLELPRISSQEASRISEQEALIAQEKANQVNIVEPQPQQIPQPTVFVAPPTPTNVVVAPQQAQQPVPVATSEPSHNVPRGQALTPEQIAAYVARQRSLIQQQATTQVQPQQIPQPTQPNPRPQTISVPVRGQQNQ